MNNHPPALLPYSRSREPHLRGYLLRNLVRVLASWLAALILAIAGGMLAEQFTIPGPLGKKLETAALLLLITIAPLLEELVFRLSMRVKKRGLALLCFCMGYTLFDNSPISTMSPATLYAQVTAAWLAAWVVELWLSEKLLHGLRGSWMRYFIYIVLGMIALMRICAGNGLIKQVIFWN